MVDNSPPTIASVAEDDDSEWEYEYHETETETFYVTLDLSSSSSHIRPKRIADVTVPDLRPAVQTSATGRSESNSSAAAGVRRAATAAPAADGAEIAASAINGDDQVGPTLELEDRVQILDFHSPNPIISYRDQIYSCDWTSTIGTDILIIAPELNGPHPVLRQGPGVSVLAVTRLKLSGRPVQLDSRQTTSSETQSHDSKSAPDSSRKPNKISDGKQVTSVKIPDGLAPNRARQNQANFLQRFIAVKAAKGETDEVTVYAQKINQGSGWRSQQHAAAERRASEAGEERDLEEGVGRSPSNRRGRVGRPRRGAWRTSGPRTAKGGLFRDYRPQLWDTEGADIRNDSTLTPKSWDQYEGGESSRHSSIANNAVSSSATPTSQPLAASSLGQQTPSLQRNEEGPRLDTGEGDENDNGQGAEDVEMEDA
ncbi:hypothetical protein JMJ35_002635 [Cladonia borealis]|uniref:Transcription factor TFIIIC triple barrel domain-containing protein n=1 Tax=Cladonia borealis TaxID=184061 RepID=A0AA39R871_9LECA|nr:hypothetical protein JMJ35_002635 [Cladonia borealis]